ncbi:Amino-acid acetyltransferase [Meiothermus luteus]|jgi:amino-acid N-acetyltransferase|uniref:Amino-acid acetyltransferase n=1 Tax=Meiothermus luteus TaxID=2026184 RepID=A0A399EK38_9DEIN|nr:N-acetyltransferase [Meiothermus luteus]RIH83690.1 Amino-acid acetyltransferase [Meiothermus luteus]RMH56324.1 MAG: N-acetyltransferase [Deinococcota bacterium]
MSDLIELGTTLLPKVRREANVELRKARIKDVEQIYQLIKYWAERGLMLVRSHNHLYENLRDFFVLEDEDGHIVGSGALHILWHDIAEVRGLAIHPERQGQGLGRWIALAAEREAKDLGIPQIFAWTLQVRFFTSLGYHVTTREALPPKVYAECSACPFYDNCREIGVTKILSPEEAYKRPTAGF